MDLAVHLLDLGAVPLDLSFLAADLESGLYPADYVVLVHETDQDNKQGCGYNGLADEGAFIGVPAIFTGVPDVLEFSHGEKSFICTKITKFVK